MKLKFIFNKVAYFFLFLSLFSCNSLLWKYSQSDKKDYKKLNELSGMQDYEWRGSQMIQDPTLVSVFPDESNKSKKEYNVSYYIHKGQSWIVLEKIMVLPSGNVKYLLVDSLLLGSTGKNQIISFGNCRWNKKPNTALVALHENTIDTKDVFYRYIKKAWRADVAKEKFVSISTQGIDCRREYP